MKGKQIWVIGILCMLALLLPTAAGAQEPPHEHAWAEGWTTTDSYHWQECTAQGCPGMEPRENNDVCGYKQHAYDWVTVREPTYTESGLEQRTCAVCEYREERELPPLNLPERFTVTLMDVSTGETAWRQIPTAGGASFPVPEDGVYVNSHGERVKGIIPLDADLTLYKLQKGKTTPGNCSRRSHTVYSGTLTDVPRTLTEADCTFVSLGLYEYAQSNCDQAYKYTLPKCKIRVHSPTLKELEAFSLENTVPNPDLQDSYYTTGVVCYMGEERINYNVFIFGFVYGVPEQNVYFSNGVLSAMDMENGDSFVLDFTDEITVITSHRELLKSCEILEDREAAVTVYGDYEEHSYEAGWTVDKAPTPCAEGSESRHCRLCGAKTDVRAIPRLPSQEVGSPWNPFEDVKEGVWFYQDVKYVYERGLMIGTAAHSFSPHMDTARGMIAAILWRLECEPESGADMSFGDVSPESYCYPAVRWAAENKIVKGYTEAVFAPEKAISRQELAAVLWRYSGSPESIYDLAGFKDRESISQYAETAMAWAVERGVLQGKGGILDPRGSATRAETAAMLRRLSQLPEA